MTAFFFLFFLTTTWIYTRCKQENQNQNHSGKPECMAYHRGQNSTFEFDVVVYNFYLDLQLNIQVSYFSTLLVDLTLFVSRFNFVVRIIQHSSLRNSTFNFQKYPTPSQSMRVSVGSANYQITPLVGASKGSSLHHGNFDWGLPLSALTVRGRRLFTWVLKQESIQRRMLF